MTVVMVDLSDHFALVMKYDPLLAKAHINSASTLIPCRRNMTATTSALSLPYTFRCKV